MYKIGDLIFRKPNKEDVDQLYQIKNKEEIQALLGGFTVGYSKEDIESWILFHQTKKNECLFIIEDFKTSTIIGHIGLYEIDYRIRKAEFALLLDTQYQGKGFGFLCSSFMIGYGFNQLNLNRISMTVLASNIGSVKLCKKIGFTEEGCLKSDQFKNGKYEDVVLMAIMKADFTHNR